MKVLLLALLFIVSTFALNQNQLIGNYTVGKQCQSSPCPRTYYGKHQNFACPKNGNNGRIYNSTAWGVSTISFDTYNLFGSNGHFEANFTSNNIIHDWSTGQGQVQIPLEQGYTLNFMPCYNGRNTSNVCDKKPNNQTLAVWKTDRRGLICEGCAFSMARNGGRRLEADNELNFDIDY